MSIVLDSLAHMECAARGCLNTLDIDLCLTVTGGFAARPPHDHGWQVDSAGGVFVCRCPEHHTKILRMPSMGEVNGEPKA